MAGGVRTGNDKGPEFLFRAFAYWMALSMYLLMRFTNPVGS